MITTNLSSWSASLQQVHAAQQDTVVVQSPLPGGVASVVRYMMNDIPSWLQISLAALVAVCGMTAVIFLFTRRRAVVSWVRTRTRAGHWALATIAVLLLATVAGGGAASWNYMQHDNAFCTGCHVMNPAFQRFSRGDNKHGDLSCHNCHQQSMYASARQLVLWVAERPEVIGVHAKVENSVCMKCHVNGQDTARWQRVAKTAGHRVHFESDSSALKNLKCVTCHGVEVHRFLPVSKTCGQSGCHSPQQTAIVLGKMQMQTAQHCTTCHGFTVEVPALATRDSARGTLVPGAAQCLGCHDMRKVLSDFDPAKDPHGGKCGTCHNAHTQRTPAEAAKSCAKAGCHDNWRNEPFHVGPSHRAVTDRCITCHVPHHAKVDASDCQGCHMRVREAGLMRAPLHFDTTKALRRRDSVPSFGDVPDDAADAPPDTPFATDADSAPQQVPIVRAAGPPAPADSFPHSRHATLACLVCHTTGSGHGGLTFERPRGCLICHHQAPAQSRCVSCHRPADLAAPRAASVTVTVSGHQPRVRAAGFEHAKHASRTCVECHTTPVSLGPAPAVRDCKDCHTLHHAAGRDCAACHAAANPAPAHQRPIDAHQKCDACHTGATVAQLTPTRSMCAVCHVPQATNHHDTRECTVCHFLADPATYRARLISRKS